MRDAMKAELQQWKRRLSCARVPLLAAFENDEAMTYV